MTNKKDKFGEKYAYVSRDVGIYDTEEEALNYDDTWVIVDGVLYSKSYEAYAKEEKGRQK